MSLEKDLQDLTQSVNLLCKAVDLNTATLSDLNSTVLEFLNKAAGEPNITSADKEALRRQTEQQHKEAMDKAEAMKAEQQAKKQAEAKTTVKKVEANNDPISDKELKGSQLYADLQDLMGEYVKAAEASGLTTAEARTDALKFLKTFAEDGKVLSLTRALFETGEPAQAAKIKQAFSKAIEDLSGDKDDAGSADDFGEGEAIAHDVGYTDEDVKKALRAYAAVEGRPAAVAKLKELTNGKTAVKDIPEEQYGHVIAGLEV